jgi:protoporphyrinogen oxidase
LVSRFLYPPLGIGVLPERTAAAATGTGRATISVGSRVVGVEPEAGGRGWRVTFRTTTGETTTAGAQVVSTMPMNDLIGMLPIPRAEGDELRSGLPYRSLACVFLSTEGTQISADTWTYFPDRSVLFGRTHEPTNWSRHMAPAGTTSLCVEVFCSEGDEIWRRPDGDLIEPIFAELDRLHFLARGRIKQAWVLRASHAYPVYEVDYAPRLARATAALARWPTLHLLGRTGTFRYLNMDAVIRDGLQLARTLCQDR